LWLHHVDARVVGFSSGSRGGWGGEGRRDGERARNNDDVVEPGEPKAMERAGGELDTTPGKVEWGKVIGADAAREMGISASRTGDGSRLVEERDRKEAFGGEKLELVDERDGVGDGDCEFGLRGEGVRVEEHSVEEDSVEEDGEVRMALPVLFGDERHGAAIIKPGEREGDGERDTRWETMKTFEVGGQLDCKDIQRGCYIYCYRLELKTYFLTKLPIRCKTGMAIHLNDRKSDESKDRETELSWTARQ
jgi:hypothetical protein